MLTSQPLDVEARATEAARKEARQKKIQEHQAAVSRREEEDQRKVKVETSLVLTFQIEAVENRRMQTVRKQQERYQQAVDKMSFKIGSQGLALNNQGASEFLLNVKL